MKQARRKQIISSALALLLTTGLVVTAQAQGPGSHAGRGHGGDMDRGPGMGFEMMAQRLDLTTEQTAAIKEIRDAGQAEALELRKQTMRLRNEKRGEMLKDEPTTKTVLTLTKKIGDLRTEMQANRMETRLAVRKLLTPEQRDKMLMFGEHQGWRESGRRGGGRHGGGCDNDGPRHPHGGPGRGNR